MTTMNTEEREERLRRIRQRSGTAYIGLMQEDIDFLLSLLDSQVASEDSTVKWDANHWMLNMFTNEEFTFAQKVEALVKYHSDAATQMRNLCVEKVKAMRDEWRGQHTNAGSLEAWRHFGTLFNGADEIITALESLTLDQVKEKHAPKA